MLNLAALRYANCFSSDGGPIDSLEESTIELLGSRYFIANARLKSGITVHNPTQSLFASVDGTGIGTTEANARFKAISEALERWAFYDVSSYLGYGFEKEPTSLGMAAFPGLFARQARAYALREAVERWAIVAWWQGLTDAHTRTSDYSEVQLWEIDHPFRGFHVYLSRHTTDGCFDAFGVGCAHKPQLAVEQTVLEMERSRILLEQFHNKNVGFEEGDLVTLQDYSERRLVYFSLPAGCDAFEHRMGQMQRSQRVAKPSKIYDGPVKGPWSAYASVWRVVFEMPTQAYLDPNDPFFYW
jgi:hypothetical protein